MGIYKKVTLDNASSNDRFVQLLRDQLDTKSPLVSKGRFFHMRCCAHIVNLIVHDGLKEIDQAVEKVRESIKYFKGSKSQIRKQKFLDCVKLLSVSSTRGLRQDCPTKWNSTFLMLDSAIYYRKAFAHLEISDSNYTSCLSAYEWDTIEKICVFLAVFYDVINVFSGTKYPNANLYYPHVFMVYFTLHDSMSSKDEYTRRMGASMMENFKKYWSDFSLTLAIAVVFDPRYKLHFIEWSYTKIYGEHNCQYSEEDLLLSSTFAEYVLYFGNVSSTTSNHASTSSSKADEATSNDTRRLYGVRAKLLVIFIYFDEFQSQETTTNKKSELQLYLEEPRMERTLKLDVLAFWKSNVFRYPVLAKMAQDFLTIPISTVASESTFSASGRVLKKHRSSLAKDIVEALICTKDWLFGGCSEIDTDDLAEDIMSLSLEVSPESGASVSVNNSSSFIKV
uniref:zinc finger BED domain-containing protein RICESLEEPER 2-like n=1 Tax=Erigeron canadensis TaxID=72917 RepID=UPI001CB891E7|nr:zinc finger BED domain-containing protein RICESLEEPER 2-like [Erigeron canadensis]